MTDRLRLDLTLQLRPRTFAARRFSKYGFALLFAGGLIATHGPPALAESGSATGADTSSAIATGGGSGFLGIFGRRDPLKGIEPNKVYRTKYGIMTGEEYRQRLMQERVKGYDAALRAGGTSQAHRNAQKRATEVEKEIKEDAETTAAAAGMLAGDREEKTAAETVIEAASAEKSKHPFMATPSTSRSGFRRGVGLYRQPARETEVRRESPSAEEVIFGSAKPSSTTAVKPATPSVASRRPVPGTEAVASPAASAKSASEVAEVKRLDVKTAPPVKPEMKTPVPAPTPVAAAPATKPEPAVAEAKPKVKAKPKPKAESSDRAETSGRSHAEMSSKQKLNMAIFGTAVDIEEGEAEAEADAPEKDAE